MCSIFGVLDIKSDLSVLRKQALEMSKRLRHRGPDWSGIYTSKNAILVHERLSIVDVNTGAQPLYNPEKTHALAVNGEIYNHKDLKKQLKVDFQFQTESDCEIILALYKEKGIEFLDDLNGIFGFCLYDSEEDAYLIGRDHIGIIPLYTGYDEHGNLYVASEMKALVPWSWLAVEKFRHFETAASFEHDAKSGQQLSEESKLQIACSRQCLAHAPCGDEHQPSKRFA